MGEGLRVREWVFLVGGGVWGQGKRSPWQQWHLHDSKRPSRLRWPRPKNNGENVSSLHQCVDESTIFWWKQRMDRSFWPTQELSHQYQKKQQGPAGQGKNSSGISVFITRSCDELNSLIALPLFVFVYFSLELTQPFWAVDRGSSGDSCAPRPCKVSLLMYVLNPWDRFILQSSAAFSRSSPSARKAAWHAIHMIQWRLFPPRDYTGFFFRHCMLEYQAFQAEQDFCLSHQCTFLSEVCPIVLNPHPLCITIWRCKMKLSGGI